VRPATREGLLLWVMHRFAEELGEHAILKGGMALRLLDSRRETNDLDYVFVPYSSKRKVLPLVERVLAGLADASVRVSVHSTMVRAEVLLDAAAVQIEASVSPACKSVPVATAALAGAVGMPSRIVRMMAPDAALAHKLAAWNERRLLRDLYDAYFLVARAGATPDLGVLRARLAHIRSRLPALRRTQRMTVAELCRALDLALAALDDRSLAQELGATLDPTELAGLALRIRVSLRGLLERLLAPPPASKDE
jgi:hypothetical protein